MTKNLVVTDALARLEAKGIHGKETLILREIAVNNGYDKPFEVMDIINASWHSRRRPGELNDGKPAWQSQHPPADAAAGLNMETCE